MLFPIIVFADSAIMCDSRGIGVHPIYFIPARIARDERLKECNRFLVGYIPENVPLLSCIEILGISEFNFTRSFKSL